MGSETMFGFWFGVVITIMCIVCAMPDLLKRESDIQQEQGLTAESGACYHTTVPSSQPATADTQNRCGQSHELEYVLPSAAGHCADPAGQRVTGRAHQQASSAATRPVPEPARAALELDFMSSS